MKHVRIEDGPRLVVQAWVASRVLLALIFVWVIWSTRTTWHDAAGNWDVAHFLRIARDGYAVNDEAAFAKFQKAQADLSGALSRLLVVAENYPNLKADANFRDLQAQLEGTENRIAIERMRFNEAARDYNTARATFPTTLVAHLFGKFAEHPYFAATPGAAEPPKVKF